MDGKRRLGFSSRFLLIKIKFFNFLKGTKTEDSAEFFSASFLAHANPSSFQGADCGPARQGANDGAEPTRHPDTLPRGVGPWRMERGRLSRHVGCGVTMRVDLIEELSEGFDLEARAKVLEGLRNGFRLGVVDEPPPRGWAPSFMSDESRARITAYFETEVAGKRMLGPFTTRPSGMHWCCVFISILDS